MTIKDNSLPSLYQHVGREHRDYITEINVTITSGEGAHVVNNCVKGKLLHLHRLFYYLKIQSICYTSFSIPRYYSISLFFGGGGGGGSKVAAVRFFLLKYLPCDTIRAIDQFLRREKRGHRSHINHTCGCMCPLSPDSLTLNNY